jgi:riboflavin synthase
MFTGLIEEIGVLTQKKPAGGGVALTIAAKTVLTDTKIGDSLAVNGVCLTVTSLKPNAFTADVMPDSLKTTTIGVWKPGKLLNLERALKVGDRFGGHVVQGHVHGQGRIRRVEKQPAGWRVEILCPATKSAWGVAKGSIAVDGVSLTLHMIRGQSLWVSLIPHTLEITTLKSLKPGDFVNLERDIR